MSQIKELIENMANNESFIEHDDDTCGQCLKEKIKSQVANEFLKAGKLSQENLKEMFEEIDNRWRQTQLYKRVKSMLDKGMNLEHIREELEKEGIDI